MQLNQHQIADIQKKLQDSFCVIKLYEWLLDSYVLVSVLPCLGTQNKSFGKQINFHRLNRTFTSIIIGRRCQIHGRNRWPMCSQNICPIYWCHPHNQLRKRFGHYHCLHYGNCCNDCAYHEKQHNRIRFTMDIPMPIPAAFQPVQIEMIQIIIRIAGPEAIHQSKSKRF